MVRTRRMLVVAAVLGLGLAGFFWLRSTPEVSGAEGLWLLGDGETVRRGLRQLAELEPAPLAGLTSAIERLGDCDRVVAHLPTLPSLEFPQPEPESGLLGLVDVFEALRCATVEDTLPSFASASREVASPVVLALAAGGVEITAGLIEGVGTRWQVEVRARSGGHPLLVGEVGPTDPVFDGRQALAHLRFATDGGLDLATLRPEGEGEGHVFNFRGDALGGLLLGETWEVALLPPPDRDAVPPVVLAVEVTSRRLATAAMEALLDEGRDVWSWATPVPARLGDADGQCLEDLRLLPSMAPCWVITERGERSHLVLGWNRRVVEQALSGTVRRPNAEASPASWAWADLDRLTRPWGDDPEASQGATAWPWVRLEVEGRRVGGVYTYEVSLVPRLPGI